MSPLPGGPQDKQIPDAALLSVLREQSSPQPWWLGYLETGVADLVFADPPRVSLYAGWPYVLVQAGPDEAATLRTSDQGTPWHSALPELMFPLDRSWLVSTLWDDDWRCVGGPPGLIQALVRHPRLEARTGHLARGRHATWSPRQLNPGPALIDAIVDPTEYAAHHPPSR